MWVNIPLVILVLCLFLWTHGANAKPHKDGDIGPCGIKAFSVCYNEPEPLGCFDNGPDTPWCHQVYNPKSPQYIKPRFWMFTPGSDRAQSIDFFHLTETLSKLQFSKSKELWVVIHGFGGTWPPGFVFPTKDALIGKDNNVIVVDWVIGSAPPNYFQAVANTRVMGAIVARILSQMVRINKIDLGRTNILGFSLGAHVAGFAGARLPGLKRIVGLDPAGPDYARKDPYKASPETRLNHTDAKFVQCIHTDGLSIFDGGFGTTESWGHVDFYANGGKVQPGCPLPIPMAIKDLFNFNFTALHESVTCSHSRAHDLFLSTILNSASSQQCKFRGFPCRNAEEWNSGLCFSCPKEGCPIAGYELDYGSPYKGRFYFGTRSNNETTGLFCGDQYLVGLRPDVRVDGSIDITFLDSSDFASDTVPFQTTDEKLLDGRVTHKVLVGNFREIPAKIRLLYKRRTDNIFFWKNGVKTFQLNLLRLIDVDRHVKELTRSVMVNSGEEITVNIQDMLTSDSNQ